MTLRLGLHDFFVANADPINKGKMMRICGIELAANDAVVCILQQDSGQFTLPECRVRKLSLPKDHSREDLQQFQFAFAKLMSDYKVGKVAIKERPTKGKFAGGAVSFKLEAAIELIAELEVVLLTAAQIKTALSAKPLPISAANAGLKTFQETAFTVAYAAHVMN